MAAGAPAIRSAGAGSGNRLSQGTQGDGTRAFVSEMFNAVKESAAAGNDLRTVYKQTYAMLKPKFGQWVIFDHCLPFDVTPGHSDNP